MENNDDEPIVPISRQQDLLIRGPNTMVINYNGHVTKLIDSRIWLTPDGDYYPPDTIHEQNKKE